MTEFEIGDEEYTEEVNTSYDQDGDIESPNAYFGAGAEPIDAKTGQDFYSIQTGGKKEGLGEYKGVWKQLGYEKLNKDGTGTAVARRGIDPKNKKHGVMKFDYVSNADCEICKQYDGKTFPRDSPNRPVIPRLEKGDGVRPFTHPNCYSKDTEVYTDKGWKLFKDLDRTEKMLSLNPDNEDMEWVKPIEYVSFESEKMISFKNKWNDILVTPEHNMVVRGWKGEIKLKKAKDCNSQVIPRSSKWIGKDIETIKIDDLEIDAKTFCKFMGYWLSEGSVTRRHKNSEQIAISQHKKGQLQMIFDDISNIPIKICKGQSKLYIFNQSLGVYLHQFGHSHEKFVPNIIKEMSPELIRLFLDAYIFGDGTIRKPRTGFKGISYNNESRQYFTSSKRLADDIGELILKVGKVPRFKFENRKGEMHKFKNGVYEIKTDMWIIKENHTKTSAIRRMNKKEIIYNDMVYCVELPKFHTLYVRRNGRCSWSGNCKCRWTKVFNEAGANEMAHDEKLLARARAEAKDKKAFDKLSYVEKNLIIIGLLKKDLGMEAEGDEFLEAVDPMPIASMAVMAFNAIKDPVKNKMGKESATEADSPYGIQSMLDTIVDKALGKEEKKEIEKEVSKDFTLDNLLHLVADKLAKKAGKKMGLESKVKGNEGVWAEYDDYGDFWESWVGYENLSDIKRETDEWARDQEIYPSTIEYEDKAVEIAKSWGMDVEGYGNDLVRLLNGESFVEEGILGDILDGSIFMGDDKEEFKKIIDGEGVNEDGITCDKCGRHFDPYDDFMMTNYKAHMRTHRSTEGGLGSGKRGHQKWMIGTYISEICPTCMISTEWEGKMCTMCGNFI